MASGPSGNSTNRSAARKSPNQEISPDNAGDDGSESLADGLIDGQAIARTLVETVARLTGYPEQMLEMDMDIEADLGIDSIKRVEILSAMEEALPGLAKITPDMMGKLKTLGQICDFLASGQGQQACKAGGQASGQPRRPCVKDNPAPIPPRKIVRPVSWPQPADSMRKFNQDGPVVVFTGDRQQGLMLKTALERKNIKAVLFTEGTTSFKDIEKAAGLILMAPLKPLEAFSAARHFAPLLQAAGAGGDAIFMTVTFLDGAFGFADTDIHEPEQGSLAGLLKTAAREWQKVRCLALDMDPAWKNSGAFTDAILEELLNCPGPSGVEIGIGPRGRVRLALESADIPRQLPQLGPDDVVVVSGGGRGVTAHAAAAMAAACRPSLAIVGRSPEPFEEPAWLENLVEQAEIKEALLEFEFKDRKPTPLQIEAAYKRYMANRELKAGLEAIRDAGSQVRYFQADVRRPEQVARVIDKIHGTWGQVTALIHGAGVLADKAIAEKNNAQFELVYSTKVDGWHSLMKACADDPLRYVVVFSSVTARSGNSGQADYAMANEALNKLAGQFARRRPDCKVISINWGPWDGGMVNEHLKRNFRRQGVDLISPQAGASAMLAEMATPPGGPVEVVVGSVFEPAGLEEEHGSGQPGGMIEPAMDLAFQQELNLESHPVLGDHRLDGKPVVPMALLAEWLGHGALHANPGLYFVGLRRVRLLKGIVLDKNTKKISLMTGKTRGDGSSFSVPVEIRDGFDAGSPVVHCRAEAILAATLPPAPVFQHPDLLKPSSPKLEVDRVYDRMLFHGAALRGIEEILRIDENGIAARLNSAPPPRQWLTDPLRSNWIGDPLVMDCAFQMAIIWSRSVCGKPSLPSYIETYHQHVERFPAGGVVAVMEVNTSSKNKLTAGFVFLDSKNRVIAKLEGYEAVMDENLERAFNAN